MKKENEGNVFLNYMTDASVINVKSRDQQVSFSGQLKIQFNDVGLQLNSNKFNSSTKYYCHARIKRMNSVQKYSIRLISNTLGENTEQQIKNIEVASGSEDEYVDVDFIFVPYTNNYFDTIAFVLERTADDLITGGRNPVIGFMELSTINNWIAQVNAEKGLAKIGVHTYKPFLMMCINGEEVHTPRSGVFELRDGIVITTFFSVVCAAEPDGDQWDNQISTNPTTSMSFIGQSKKRYTDSFTLDYIYSINEVEEGT